MNTQVKIYREKENESLVLDQESQEKYNKLMEELGIQKPNSSQTKPSVYTPINDFTHNCLKVLCPMRHKYKSYNASTIPVEVLEVIAYCEENKLFDKLWIYSDTTDPDPVLIGENYMSQEDREKDYSWRMNRFLLARWGDCAYEIPELIEMAKKRVQKHLKATISDFKGMFLSFEENPEGMIEKSIKEFCNPFNKRDLSN